eukprot:2307292-Pyramimonas_sp.AAC.1
MTGTSAAGFVAHDSTSAWALRGAPSFPLSSHLVSPPKSPTDALFYSGGGRSGLGQAKACAR